MRTVGGVLRAVALLSAMLGTGSSWGAVTDSSTAHPDPPALPSRFVVASNASPTDLSPVLLQATDSNVTVFGVQPDANVGSALSAFRSHSGAQATMLAIGARRYVPNPSRPPTGGVLLIEVGRTNPAHWHPFVIATSRRNALFGHSLASLGDVDGDGFGDLLVGSPRFSQSRYWEGAAYLYRGGADWGSNTLSVISNSTVSGQAGLSVAVAGDVNGDGFPDFIVGIPGEAKSTYDCGAAMLFLGSSNLTSEPVMQWSALGDQAGAKFGAAVSSAGDVNNDGFADVLVGAPRFSGSLSNAGRVFLYLGGSNGMSRTPALVLDGPVASAGFGEALSPLGDLNHDGFSDVIIGAPGLYRGTSQWPGAAYIYRGNHFGLESSSTISFAGEKPGSRFGASLAAGGDVNGDRIGDLLIGSPAFGSKKVNEGRVHLFLGITNGFNPQQGWVMDGGEDQILCGSSVTMVPDINGDGCDEFMVGSPRYKFAKREEGRADLFYGSRTQFVEREFVKANERQPQVSSVWPIRNFVFGSTTLVLVAVWMWRRNTRTILHRERKRLARDMHDEVGVHLARLESLNPHNDSPQSCLDGKSSSAAAQEAACALHQAVWAVDPDCDTLESLVSFLGEQGERFFASTSIQIRFDLPEVISERNLEGEVRKYIILCLQEAFANVLKHSGASEVWLHVKHECPWLNVSVEDNGKGLPSTPTRRFGNGLKNMRQRAEAMGGEFIIENQPHGGTRVHFRFRV